MPPEYVTITREHLYEKVCSMPMQKLARECVQSNVGLVKLCRRDEIPVHGRRY